MIDKIIFVDTIPNTPMFLFLISTFISIFLYFFIFRYIYRFLKKRTNIKLVAYIIIIFLMALLLITNIILHTYRVTNEGDYDLEDTWIMIGVLINLPLIVISAPIIIILLLIFGGH